MITNTLPELPQQGFIDRGNSRGAIKPKELQYIPIFTFRHDYILVNDIVCLEGQSNYTMIYLKNGRKILCSKTLKHFSTLALGNFFLRIHKSYIINLECINFYAGDESKNLELSNGLKIGVSRRNKRQFEETIGNFKSENVA